MFLDELFKAESRGQSGDTQGGYYYPNDHTKTGVTVGAYTATEYASERFKFNVKTDLLNVVKSLRKRNVPVFQDGYYRCIADPSFMKDLRADQGFREVARYPGMGAPNPLMGMSAPNAALYPGRSVWPGSVRGWRARHAFRLRVRGCALLRVHQLPQQDCNC